MDNEGEYRVDLNKNRMVGLDIFRVFSVLIVFLFHSWMHIDCQYGFIQDFITMGAVFMTGFFMLSGVCLYFSYEEIDLSDIKLIKKFYIKRLIAILPLYYIVSCIYILFLGDMSLKQNIILFPVEAMGLQSLCDKFFSITHNGGTWFISCLLFCYISFPFAKEILMQLSKRERASWLLINSFIVMYFPYVIYYFNLDQSYSNPFFRLLEFFIGMILASFVRELRESFLNKFIFNPITALFLFSLIFVSISMLVKNNVYVNQYMMYNVICIPVFSCIIICMSNIEFAGEGSKTLFKKLSDIAYAFF